MLLISVLSSMYHLERVKKKIGKCETVSSLGLYCFCCCWPSLFCCCCCCRYRLLLLHHSIVSLFRVCVYTNVCVSARVIGKKNVREIDKQNESNGIEEKSDSVAKRCTRRNRFGKSPLEKFVDFSIYSSHTQTHLQAPIHGWCAHAFCKTDTICYARL